MPASQLIFLDFGNADESDIIRLTTVGSLRDLATLGVELKEVLELHITDGEISASAVVQRRDGMWASKVLHWD
ncbi:hypothetical protein FHW69_003058 [Luteibacter sp. Sphag1AF]|uniref:hypothetical protein n=1 Tax=Luteibacter sp. Sphag1AF TaxID=2587031 RepID=UPI0016137E37|nr:hypothetical protein [Luteibacter sp. Sphag1AF]MBB3228423.1 hypothetical protein [Luteibacter sp. Sphag1AF]